MDAKVGAGAGANVAEENQQRAEDCGGGESAACTGRGGEEALIIADGLCTGVVAADGPGNRLKFDR